MPINMTDYRMIINENDARKRMQVLRILRKLRKAGKIHEVYGLQRAAAGSRQTES